ncbi:DUF2225 domain-containing protein [Desulfothermobacter acidiphilus]|uniref:DUF2225 domain-containing protein n=1 Tax=Desulfothermobacter acidiphilus TaxID=1938353 RepID=UPI003F8A7D26
MKSSERLIAWLKQVPLLELLPNGSLAQLSQRFQVVNIKKGESLPLKGGVIILQGRGVISYPDRTTIGGPGTAVGLLSLLGVEVKGSLRALEDTAVLIIGEQNLRALLLSHPEIGVDLLYSLAAALEQRGVSLDRVVPPASEPRVESKEDRPPEPASASERDEPFYYKDFTCPFCQASFPSLALKSRFLRVAKIDADFLPYYEGDFNPLFYEVLVCPHCGFAFTEEIREIKPRFRSQVEDCLRDLPVAGRDYGGQRDWETALEAFYRLSRCAKASGVRKSLLGKIYLKIAWLYRLAEKEEEKEFLEKARNSLREAFEEERMGGAEAELNLMYLLGELSFRLGDRDQAARWWGMVLHHPQRNAQPRILQRTRERWYELRKEGELVREDT